MSCSRFCTVPLVLHTRTKEATRAAKTYFVFSLGGAAFAFASMLFLVSNGVTVDFALGGLLHRYPYGQKYLTYVFYLLGFFGFGVKAAVFPRLPVAAQGFGGADAGHRAAARRCGGQGGRVCDPAPDLLLL